MTYRAPLAEMNFLLNEVVDYPRLADTSLFAESDQDLSQAILGEAAKLSEDILAPLNRQGDLHPAYLENGVVRCSPGYKEGYRAIADGGWVGICAPAEQGGMGLPLTLATCVGEMMASACLAISLNPLMSQGQIEALDHHASDELKQLYLPKLISGQWNGTMNLTEPQAGSDVGALRSKAEPNDDGSFAISGQKIFISWGDHDIAENICHLVLARLPGGVEGTKGISLFMVPKYLPDAEGNPGAANSLKAVSLEHKMGLHGSPTAVMAFDRATGWIVGKEGGGMAAMFTMMNNARLGVGVEGLGIAEAACQQAMAFAAERKQGKALIKNGTGTIMDHADVRRMLLTMKSLTMAARAICYDTAISADMARATGDATWQARGSFLTPIAKAFGTDVGSEVADLGVQVHGGMGYIEETGAAQYLRDVRVTRIYEGTNGIQSMDLVGRKMMDGGAAAHALLDEMTATAKSAKGSFPEIAEQLNDAVDSLTNATDWMLKTEELNDRLAGGNAYLRAFGLTLGAHYLLKSALVENDRGSRRDLARFYTGQHLPFVAALCSVARQGAGDLYAIEADALG